jgi:hypothetical protein
MVTDPSSDLAQHIGDIIWTALESTRLGYCTDTRTATDIATGNIMSAVYAARPALAPQAPGYPPTQEYQPPPEERRPRHGWRTHV